MTNQDTITVELPIKAYGPWVSVHGLRLTRDEWRRAANTEGRWYPYAQHIAPAVVAWIERDEWEPLDLPEVGRTIKATLRDGRVETFKVRKVSDGSWAGVWKADSGDAARFIERTPDKDAHEPDDVVAWEYVDEPKFKAGDWVLVGEDPDVHHRYRNRVGFVVGPELSWWCYSVQFLNGVKQLVTEGYLHPATPKDVKWEAGDTVPAGTNIGREWVGESVVTGHRSLFGVPDSRTAATDRKIVWLGEFNG